jgi:hypothetical protein
MIKAGKTTVYLYRHHDGYPACAGVDLAEALATSKTCTALVQTLLDRRYDKQSYETDAKRMYEVTTDVHGDIEWFYKIVFSGDFGRVVKVACCGLPYNDKRDERLATVAKEKAILTVEEFTAYAKHEEADMLARIEARKAGG